HLFYTHLPASLVSYNAQRAGLDFPLFSFAQMIGAAAVGVAMLCAAALLGGVPRGLRQAGRAKWLWIALDGALLVALAIRLIAGEDWDGSPMRALPVLSLGMIVIAGRRREEEAGGGALFIVAVYSLAVLARVALRVPSGGAFGGFFLPTSLILFCHLFLRTAPQVAGRWARDLSTARRTRLVGAWMLIARRRPRPWPAVARSTSRPRPDPIDRKSTR